MSRVPSEPPPPTEEVAPPQPPDDRWAAANLTAVAIRRADPAPLEPARAPPRRPIALAVAALVVVAAGVLVRLC